MTTSEFLKEEFNKRKERNPNFSLRACARWLGVSPAQLSQMLSGKRPVTLKSLDKISVRLGVSPIDRSKLADSLLSKHPGEGSKLHLKRVRLADDRFKVVADWYHFAILCLSKTKNAVGNVDWIAGRLGISVREATLAVKRLTRLNLLSVWPSFSQTSDDLEVTSDVPSEAIQKHHRQLLELASEKLTSVPPSSRDFQNIMLPLRLDQVPKLRKLVDEFLETASNVSEEDAGVDVGKEVYCVSVQVFPLTELEKGDRS